MKFVIMIIILVFIGCSAIPVDNNALQKDEPTSASSRCKC